MWECPQCGRSFKRRDQNHTCTLITNESLFTNRSPGLRYDRKDCERFWRFKTGDSKT